MPKRNILKLDHLIRLCKYITIPIGLLRTVPDPFYTLQEDSQSRKISHKIIQLRKLGIKGIGE